MAAFRCGPYVGLHDAPATPFSVQQTSCGNGSGVSGVKPAPFGYRAPHSVDEALGALAEPDAVVLAGGQSLLLEMVYRDTRPALVVDINGISALAGMESAGTSLRIGALVRHRELEQ